MPDVLTKRCTRCNRRYPATLDNFQSNGSKGLSSWCKSCKNATRAGRNRQTYRRPGRKPLACRVVVVENAEGERRALSYTEWDCGEPYPEQGWRVIGKGSKLLALGDGATLQVSDGG